MSLRARDIQLRIKEQTLLHRVSVAVAPGEMVALIGPNGAGKSTLLRCLAGVQPVDSGHITIKNLDINRYGNAARAREVSYLPQNLNTPFAFHVAELLALGGTYDHRHPALDVMELQPLLGRSLISLSGGELQRATIARALIAPAPILLLDEPLAHLDLRHALRLLEYLRDRADDGQSVVLSLHGPLLRHARPGRVWLLKDGKLHFDGPVADLDDTTLAEVFALTKDNLLIFT